MKMEPINFQSLAQGDRFPSTTTLMSLIFMTLKLCGQISWNWFLVFLPMIVSAVIWGGLALWEIIYRVKMAKKAEELGHVEQK